jgi:lipoprotein-anchoring transpeptidase ErfK/SrfK
MKLALTIVFVAAALFGAVIVHPVRASGGEQYIVQQGDTLASIAAGYGIPVEELLAVNNLNWDAWIRAGQQLIIPGYAASTTGYAGLPPAANTPSGFIEPAVTIIDRAVGLTANPDREFGDAYLPVQSPDASPGQILQSSPWVGFDPYAYPEPGFRSQAYNDHFGTAPARAALPAPAPINEKWIDVDLTGQTLTAYEGHSPVFWATVSTGTSRYPTVVGTFEIYVKYAKARMRGGSGAEAYDVPDVPNVMYFHKGYGLHGTYWHDNFGTPMSHGCVNLSVVDSEWLFNWASVGTKVVTHY